MASEGLTPEAQQTLLYLILGGVALLVLIRLVKMLLYSLPLLALGLYYTKPSLHGFGDFLALVDKKTDRPAPSGGKNSGYIMGLVKSAIETTKSLFVDPTHSWVYLDLVVLILAKRKGEGRFALGILQRWIMLEYQGYPAIAYARQFADVVSSWVPEESWSSFASLPPPSAAASSDQTRTPLILEASVNLGRRGPGGDEDGERSTSSGGQRLGGETRSMKRYMDRAQALAEAGKFDDAGRCVEEGLVTCRGHLKGGTEEEIEFLLVAGAFYEAGRVFTGYVKCLREAAQLCVAKERWGKAAELFDSCATAWYKEKERRR